MRIILISFIIISNVFAAEYDDFVGACPSGWTMVNRVQGQWCIKVFAGTMNVTQAEENCKAVGATLTGVENESEKKLIHAEGVQILRNVGQFEGAVWLGGRRRIPCLYPTTNATGCVPWVPFAFEWTDNYTTGRSMFHFRQTQPDYYLHQQDRIYMLIVDGTLGSGGTRPGDLEDAGGAAAYNAFPLNCIRGYACGRQPPYTD